MKAERIHVYPHNDLKEHQRNMACWCEPSFDDPLVIHNSLKGLEFIEAEEREAILAGLADMAAGRVRPLEEVRKQLGISQ